MKKLITFKALMEYLCVKRSKLYELIKNDGLAPALYIGVSPRWYEDDVINWLSAQSKKKH